MRPLRRKGGREPAEQQEASNCFVRVFELLELGTAGACVRVDACVCESVPWEEARGQLQSCASGADHLDFEKRSCIGWGLTD